MYDLKTRLLVDNPIDRYSIGDRTEGLKYGSDGSLKISVEPDTAPQSASWPLRIGKLVIALQNARIWPIHSGDDAHGAVGSGQQLLSRSLPGESFCT